MKREKYVAPEITQYPPLTDVTAGYPLD